MPFDVGDMFTIMFTIGSLLFTFGLVLVIKSVWDLSTRLGAVGVVFIFVGALTLVSSTALFKLWSQEQKVVAAAHVPVFVDRKDEITTSLLGTGSVLDSLTWAVEGSGFGNDPGLPIAKIGTEYGDYLYAILAPQDIGDGTIVELVGVYRGKDHIATVARRRIGWSKPSP